MLKYTTYNLEEIVLIIVLLLLAIKYYCSIYLFDFNRVYVRRDIKGPSS